MSKVSFDFDGVLSTAEGQNYAQDLIKQGIDVWVTTRRVIPQDNHNSSDLFEITDRLNIPSEKVTFLQGLATVNFLLREEFLFHIGLDEIDINLINTHLNGKGVLFSRLEYKDSCNELIIKSLG